MELTVPCRVHQRWIPGKSHDALALNGSTSTDKDLRTPVMCAATARTLNKSARNAY